jgi:hypothetical protein
MFPVGAGPNHGPVFADETTGGTSRRQIEQEPPAMGTAPPEGLTLKRHRDLHGRERRPWARRALLAVVGLVVLLGLGNAFGQRPTASTSASPAADLSVTAPSRLRGGLYFEARFRIDAHRTLRDATLVLDEGWLHGMTLNTVEPAPAGESGRDGDVALELGRIAAGTGHVLYLQFQVNPTTVGRRSNDVALYDRGRLLARIDRTMTVFP